MPKINPTRIKELMDEFVKDHNENTMKVAEEINQEQE